MNTAEYLLGMVSLWMRNNLSQEQGESLPAEVRDFVDPDQLLFSTEETLGCNLNSYKFFPREIPGVVIEAKAGRKIHAIKELRTISKMSLADAKYWIDENWEKLKSV